MYLEKIDWALIIGFFVLSLVVGIIVSRRAGKNTVEGRSKSAGAGEEYLPLIDNSHNDGRRNAGVIDQVAGGAEFGPFVRLICHLPGAPATELMGFIPPENLIQSSALLRNCRIGICTC